MNPIRKATGFVLIAAVTAVVSGSVGAMAHSSATYYPAKWAVADRAGVPFRFTTDFPKTVKRDRVQDGKQQWNNQNRAMYFNFQNTQSDYSPYPPSVCPGTFLKNGVHWGPIDGSGSTAALTYLCRKGDSPDHLYSFQIKFDSDEAGLWYSDTGSPGSNEIDFWSVASHEFGHGTGWSAHFDEFTTECPRSGDLTGRHTMCAKTLTSTTMQRSLAPHDQDTFAGAYPAR